MHLVQWLSTLTVPSPYVFLLIHWFFSVYLYLMMKVTPPHLLAWFWISDLVLLHFWQDLHQVSYLSSIETSAPSFCGLPCLLVVYKAASLCFTPHHSWLLLRSFPSICESILVHPGPFQTPPLSSHPMITLSHELTWSKEGMQAKCLNIWFTA